MSKRLQLSRDASKAATSHTTKKKIRVKRAKLRCTLTKDCENQRSQTKVPPFFDGVEVGQVGGAVGQVSVSGDGCHGYSRNMNHVASGLNASNIGSCL